MEQKREGTQSVDDLLAVVSHGLRGTMGTILIWTQLLRSGGLSPEKSNQALDAISRGARAQLRVFESAADLVRLTLGSITIDRQRIDLGAVTREAVEKIRNQARAKSVTLAFDAGSAPVEIRGDAGRMLQVLGHLLDNAIRATPAAGRVDVVLRRDSTEIEIAVKDTGAGLDPAWAALLTLRTRVPDEFARRTCGYGLPIALGLVELHGGALRLVSDGPGRGTVALVRLPGLPADSPDCRSANVSHKRVPANSPS